MGTYYLPRDVKGENRILFIFTTKGLIYTMLAAAIGLLFYFIFSMIGLTMVGIIITAVFALIGFAIGTLKVPEVSKFEFSKKTGGENIDDVIRRAIKFKISGKKVYVYKEGKKNEKEKYFNYYPDLCGSCRIGSRGIFSDTKSEQPEDL